MERIVYRKTLDLYKSGVQFTLQGFQTADKFSRRIAITLMANGDTIDLAAENITAVIYVTSPASATSIESCEINGNTIIYDVLPIDKEGITEMQIKVIKGSLDGARSVLAMPKFALEVTKSNGNDEEIVETEKFSALENALAQATAVYNQRFERVELTEDCIFRVYYADGTTYETDVLKRLFYKGEALVSQSWARGGTGIREGEDTDNSMYYSNVSQSASNKAESAKEEAVVLLNEAIKKTIHTAFSVDLETGILLYESQNYKFTINNETGMLEAEELIKE
jgi:hypothetical protein